MRWALVLVAVGGCGQLFSLDKVTLDKDADAAIDGGLSPGCVSEDFTGGFDTNLFLVEDPPSNVQVLGENDRLVLRPSPNVTGSNGLLTTERRDLTGGYVQVNLLRPLVGAGNDVELKITPDTTTNNYFMIFVNDTNIGFRRESELSGRAEADDPPYSTSKHAYWRITFPSATLVQFFTSLSGLDGTWTSQHVATIDFPITTLHVALIGVRFTGGITAPDEAQFDDLTICPAQ